MTFTIHKEAPKVKLVTMGQADKEISMAKEPVKDYYPPGVTEPQVRPAHIPAPVLVAEEEKPVEEAPVVEKAVKKSASSKTKKK